MLRVAVTTRPTLRGICAQALDPHVTHCWTCGSGPRQGKHNNVRDEWLRLLRKAGWRATPEQLMALPEATHKRADILATANTGELFALDVTFTMPLDDSEGPLALALPRAATAKAGRYHTTLGGTLPGNVRFVPLTYLATRPHLHSAGLTLLHRIVRGMAARECSASKSTPGATCHPVCPRSGAVFP